MAIAMNSDRVYRSDAGLSLEPSSGPIREIVACHPCMGLWLETLLCGHTIMFPAQAYRYARHYRRCAQCAVEHANALRVKELKDNAENHA